MKLQKVYLDTTEVSHGVSTLCKHSLGTHSSATSTVKMGSFPPLAKYLKKFRATSAVIPSEAGLIGMLPLSRKPEDNWNAFGEAHPAFISNIVEEVEVIRSLQCPKVITIIGSDGAHYKFLAKPKDDLRKDSRVMEVNSLVNKLLAQDMDCRRRQLRIQTYAVTPLDEETGLIEWVPNLTGYRTAAYQFYPPHAKEHIKHKYDSLKSAQAADRYKQVMEEFPSRFYQWFALRFPEPRAWLDARVCFTHSCAVMSMVGTVIGLGDRHGENILLDMKSGHVVHVDFNAIFSKGETFLVPERVPFRLTRNMVDAMGLTGYEGAFRRVCEITMHVLKRNRDMVLSVLETFVHDPLLEFCRDTKDPSRKGSSAKKAKSVVPQHEPVNEKARAIISKIERTLLGKVGPQNWEKKENKNNMSRAVGLSVEGHIEHLIGQAIDPSNLGSMYAGWSPWL